MKQEETYYVKGIAASAAIAIASLQAGNTELRN